MDPALIYGPYGVLVCLVYAVVHLYRENTELRNQAMDLLRKYQERDDEERRYRLDEDRRRQAEDRIRAGTKP